MLNGESKEFVADESDIHVSDEDLKSFYDNVKLYVSLNLVAKPPFFITLIPSAPSQFSSS